MDLSLFINMILHEIQLKNFLSHKSTDIEFRHGQKILIDGVSGAGKSSIADAIIWAFYGKGRSDNRALIRKGASKAEVSVTLRQTAQENGIAYRFYLIERSVDNKGRQKLAISEAVEFDSDEGKKLSFKPIGVTGTKNLQDYLETQLLRSSYTLFINSIVYPQDNVENFVRQTAAKRKDIILEIINAAALDEYYAKTRDKVSELEKGLLIDEAAKKALNDAIEADGEKTLGLSGLFEEKEATQKVVKNLEDEVAQYRDDQFKMKIESERLEGNTKKQNTLNNELWGFQDRYEKLKAEIDKGTVVATDEDEKRLKEIDAEIEKGIQAASAKVKWSNEMLALLRDKPAEMDFGKIICLSESRIKQLESETGEICPELNKECPIISKKRNEEISELKEKIRVSQEEEVLHIQKKMFWQKKVDDMGEEPKFDAAKQRDMTFEADKLQAKIKTASEAGSKKAMLCQERDMVKTMIESKSKEINDVTSEIESAKKLIAELYEKCKKLEDVSSRLSFAKQKYDIVLAKIALAEEAKKRVEENKEKVAVIEGKIKKDSGRYEGLKLLKEAFSPNGIKAVLIDYLIPNLENKINNILSKLSDFQVKLDTQRSGAGEGVVLEGLFISIFNDRGEEFDFDNYSGSEKLRISYAINESLADVQKIDFRILDEAIYGLDKENEAKYIDVVLKLKENVNQLICISHLQGIKDIFDDKIYVQKINGESSVI